MPIIAIVVIAVVVALVLSASGLALEGTGRRAKVKRQELGLKQRRAHMVDEHQAKAQRRGRKADQMGLRARIAELEARRVSAEARVRREMAVLNQRGIADHELIEGRRSAAHPTRLEDFRAGRRDRAR